MNKVSKRAWVVLAVAFLILGALAAFVGLYFIKARDWVSFPGSPHLYSGVNPSTGVVTDRNGVMLVDATQERVYTDDAALKKSILHLVGDRYGYIEAPLLGEYTDKMIAYNPVTGIYSTSEGACSIRLTLSASAQKTALEALGGMRGTVGVYNYETGEVLCAVSSPNYDPDNVPDIENDTSGAYEGVYVNRFTRATYTPGSIFKVVTTTAALETVPDIRSQTFTCEGSVIIGGEQINCTGTHGTQTLSQALSNSCNCAFAQIALQVGAETLQSYAERAGITDSLAFDGITTASGNFDVADASQPSLAWAGIGQYTDLVNPCQYMTYMGMIANGGEAAVPYLMDEITSGERTRYEAETQRLELDIEPATAQEIADMMRDNVVTSYGAWLFPDVRVCAKSGTAETVEGKASNAMFAGFIQDSQYPLAFIVIVEEGGYGSQTAAPIAGQVLAACIADMN